MDRFAAALIVFLLVGCATNGGAPEGYTRMCEEHPEYAVCGGRK